MQHADYLAYILEYLERTYHRMGESIAPPEKVKNGSLYQTRHLDKSDPLLCYLKGVKLVSTLKGAQILLVHGHVQEVGALCRMADDFCCEILFFLRPLLDDESPSQHQVKFFEDFFQEEFEDTDHLVKSHQSRDSVTRTKINAGVAKITEDELNPHDAQNVFSIVHKTFSGYIHGAYPHIMEMYGGNPPHFHMSGMLNTPRISEWEGQLIIYVQRALMVTEVVAMKFGLAEVDDEIKKVRADFETSLNRQPLENAAAQMRNLKK